MIGKFADEKPKCPLQMHFGEKDEGIPMSTVDEIKKKQPQAETYVYPGAAHGFYCDERASYNKDAADLAWSRTQEFLGKHMKVDRRLTQPSSPRKRGPIRRNFDSLWLWVPARARNARLAGTTGGILKPPLLHHHGIAGAQGIAERHVALDLLAGRVAGQLDLALLARGAKPPAIAIAFSTVMSAT